MSSEKKEEEFLVSLSDFFVICKRNKYKIVFLALIFACAGAVYSLTRPIEYTAEATFREKAKSSGLAQGFAATFFSGGLGGSDSEAVSMMKSRKLMEELVKQMALQAVIQEDKARPGHLAKVVDNLKVYRAYSKENPKPVLRDPSHPIKVSEVIYKAEIPYALTIKFLSNNTFQVINEDNEIQGEGSLGIPFSHDNYSFTLMIQGSDPLDSSIYIMTLLPLEKVAENLASGIAIRTDFTDKGLLKLTYTHPDRHMACDILNNLMGIYQNYLKEEQARVSTEQLVYLEARQQKVSSDLEGMMDAYAAALIADAQNSGFASSEQEMQFHANVQQIYRQKLLDIDLEIKRLQNARDEGIVYYDRHQSDGDPMIINSLLGQIRDLKQSAYSLDVALRNVSQKDPKEAEESMHQQLVDLDYVQQCLKEAKVMQASLGEGRTLASGGILFESPKYLIKAWHDKLTALGNDKEKISEKNNCKSAFEAYLVNLIQLFEGQEQLIQERLAHQQDPNKDFAGIDLQTADELYKQFCREINVTQSKTKQIEFIITHMEDDNFEMSSLSSFLDDGVSSKMIHDASGLNIALRDQNNRSQKEQERLREEIGLKKGVLKSHLKQMMQLQGLHEKLLQDKIYVLQSAALELTQQRISILQRELADYIVDRLDNLKQQTEVIKLHQKTLQDQMALVPNKWVAEKMINEKMELNQGIVREITKMVESKNISDHLEIVQSAPIDTAIPPIHPRMPKLIPFTLMGAFLGMCSALFFIFFQSIIAGVYATEKNLKISHQMVAGSLSRRIHKKDSGAYLDSDLETLRHLSAFFDPSSTSRSLLLIEGKGPDYSTHLATLLAMKGMRMLVVQISFDAACPAQESPGLLQYLEGKAPIPKVITEAGYDIIKGGGISRYSLELVTSKVFQELLSKLKSQYDGIIAVSHAKPGSAEAESLLALFDRAIITIADEKLHQLADSIALAEAAGSKKKIAFVIAS